MKSIAYIVPYFGKFPNTFQLWLNSCKNNETVNWLIFTDDRRTFHYPENVKTCYMSFDEIKEKIQSCFDFDIVLETPYKLCDYRTAYGYIFSDYLKGYDFWGYCDVDLLWGNIRKFITDDVLISYVKIGFQGHSTLYLNKPSVNEYFMEETNELPNYREIFTSNQSYFFDEDIINKLYHIKGIPYFTETVFAHLNKYEPAFYLGHLPEEDAFKNYRQVFTLENGTLTRCYLDHVISKEEFMYIHFFCRNMSLEIQDNLTNKRLMIVPNQIYEYDGDVTIEYLKKHGKRSKLSYILTSLYLNRNKITINRVINSILYQLNYYKKKRRGTIGKDII